MSRGRICIAASPLLCVIARSDPRVAAGAAFRAGLRDERDVFTALESLIDRGCGTLR
jgi:hypothetical protein